MKVHTEQLLKRFGSITAVNGVDFTAEAGELTTLLGPSGCGKTTILRCIAGLEIPDSGRISIGDREVFNGGEGTFVQPQQRDIGFVFQTFDVWPHMNVYENVSYPLKIRDVPSDEIEDRVDEVLGLANIQHLKDKNSTDLSGGQQARVGICRSLVYEPKVLLCDEPLTGLDRNLRKRMRTELRRIQRELGITMIYVTHSQPEAMSISDQIYLMNTDGRVEQSGTSEAIYQSPQSLYAFEFFGSSQLISGERTDSNVVDTPIGRIESTMAIPADGRVKVGFRPQHVHLSQDGFGADEPNTWEGVLQNRLYMGDVYEYDVKVGDIFIQARTGEDLSAASGETVNLRVNPEHVFVFPEVG